MITGMASVCPCNAREYHAPSAADKCAGTAGWFWSPCSATLPEVFFRYESNSLMRQKKWEAGSGAVSALTLKALFTGLVYSGLNF
jgi:hypothetical protein